MSYMDDEVSFLSLVPENWPRWAIPVGLIAVAVAVAALVIFGGAVSW